MLKLSLVCMTICCFQHSHVAQLLRLCFQAGGEGVMSKKHAATLTKGSPGVLHGSLSYLLQDDEGQIIDPHSISAG